MSKEQTAVEWLMHKLSINNCISIPGEFWNNYKELVQQAKEMEKEQIISFAYKQIENCHNEMGEIMYSKVPEELFNDTYGE